MPRLPLLPCLAVTLALLFPAGASAGTTPNAERMTVTDVQGMGCIAAGAIGAIGAYVYNDMIVAAVAASAGANPVLLLPFVASGFVTGCGVGTTVIPTLLHFTFGY